jgi:hypothetical protein
MMSARREDVPDQFTTVSLKSDSSGAVDQDVGTRVGGPGDEIALQVWWRR